MKIFKIGKYRTLGSYDHHYSLKQKTFWGWKEISRWWADAEGDIKYDKNIQELRDKGHIVLED